MRKGFRAMHLRKGRWAMHMRKGRWAVHLRKIQYSTFLPKSVTMVPALGTVALVAVELRSLPLRR